jgi:uncharacterized repeat protein (TIGR02543 family)
MAAWTPFGVSLNITAVAETVKRISATTFTVKMKVSWSCASSGNKTDYGMKATSGGSTVTINAEGTKRHDATAYLTGTYTVSENVAVQDKSITVKFENFNKWHDDSAEKSITLTVDVPAWTSYTVSYNVNGGTGTIASQTKWHGKDLTITSAEPTKTGHRFIGWALTKANADAGSWYYAPGSTCGKNEDLTLYAVWKANTYKVTYDANGGTGEPTEQTKVYGSTLKLSSVKPTRADYTFKGWATSASGAVDYAAGDNYTANAGVTLYAVWELSYTKPRIKNLEIKRVDNDGNVSDEGERVNISFSWEVDKQIRNFGFSWKLASESDYSINNINIFVPTGSSGEFNETLTATFDPEIIYTVAVIITDVGGQSILEFTVPGKRFPIDVKPPEAEGEVGGVAIHKQSEIDGAFEVGCPMHLYDSLIFRNDNIKVGSIYMNEAGSLIIYSDDASDSYFVLTEGNYSNFCLPLSGGALTGSLGVDANLYSTSNYVLYLGVDNNRELLRLYQAGGVTNGNKWFAPCDGVLIDLGTTNNPWQTAYIKELIAPTVTSSKVDATTVNATTVNASNGVMNKVYGSGNYSVKFGVNNNTELAWVYQSGGSTTGTKWFAPTTDKNLLLGSSNYKWTQLYAGTTTISTSDRNEKKDFADFDERYEALFKKLKPQTFKFIDGTSGRTHSGFIAQDIEESLAEVGLTALDFAGFCKDVKTERFENAETGEVTFKEVLDENGNPQHIYSLRYEEFIALNTYMIQKLQAEKSELQDKVSRLEERLEKLEKLIETQ